MNDEQILDLYFARDEQAVAETDRKYGGYCFTLANSILHSDQDAEETVSDTYSGRSELEQRHRRRPFNGYSCRRTGMGRLS